MFFLYSIPKLLVFNTAGFDIRLTKGKLDVSWVVVSNVVMHCLAPALFPAVVMGGRPMYAVRGVSVTVSFIGKTWISFHLDVRSSSWTRGRVTV